MKDKTLGKLKQDAQKEFNAYIRKRDEGKPCISCGQTVKLEAGHFFPVRGYDGLRFDEDNVHGECPRCNRFDDSHLIHYSMRLCERIGQERYNALLDRASDYKKYGKKWMRYEIQDLIKHYKILTK